MQKITIKAARVNSGRTQEQMSRELGVSLKYYNEIENGNIKIKPTILYAICHLTGFSEDEISLPEKST